MSAGGGDTGGSYERALAGEGEYWDDFVAQRLARGELPGSIDWRLTFTQFRYNHDWRPLALGPQLTNFRLPEIRHVLLTAAPRPGMRVLDLGCGAGWLSLELARRGAHVTALDISPSNLALARYMADTNTRNFPFLYQGFAGLPCRLEDFGSVDYGYADLNNVVLPEGEYDAVVTWDALHHVAELERLLEQVRHALKPGGLFVGVDHSFATPRTHNFNNALTPWIENLYAWITEQDPGWLYSSAIDGARHYDWGPLSVDYDPTPVPGFDEFSRVLFSEMLDVVRRGTENRAGVASGEESPFEDVSAQRLLRALYTSFHATTFRTICPFIQPEQHIPHYRHENERIFQHYLAAALVMAGDEAIAQRRADGQWILFEMTPERQEAEMPPWLADFGVDYWQRLLDTLEELREDVGRKNDYIARMEAELERKSVAFAELETHLRRTEAELEKARQPRLPWKRRGK